MSYLPGPIEWDKPCPQVTFDLFGRWFRIFAGVTIRAERFRFRRFYGHTLIAVRLRGQRLVGFQTRRSY